MLGVVLSELQAFIVDCFGPKTWERIEASARTRGRGYLRYSTYPDQELVQLVQSAAEASGSTANEILKAFGERLAPVLIEAFPGAVAAACGTLDVLAHIDTTVHQILRVRGLTEGPPRLHCQRVDASAVIVEYRSPNKLCALAVGLAHGVAKYFGDELELEELQCTERGADHCALRFHVAPRAAVGS